MSHSRTVYCLVLLATLISCPQFALAAMDAAHSNTEPTAHLTADSDSALSAASSYRALLQKAVLETGGPKRSNYATDVPDKNSRIKSVTRRSSYDGNRFLFEAFVKYPELLPELRQLRAAMLTEAASLSLVNRKQDDQLAFWLNLHNVLVIDHIAHMYPKSLLDGLYEGKDAWVNLPLYVVGDQTLSLADIKFAKILPLAAGRPEVIYGLYEGYVSGPSIQSEPFTGRNLKAMLKVSAIEFVNSSRGTYPEYGNSVRASGFYQRHQAFIPNFPYALKAHLRPYLAIDEQDALAKTELVTTDIDDWRIADVYGTVRPSNSHSVDSEFVMNSTIRRIQTTTNNNSIHLDRRQLHQLKMLQRRQKIQKGSVEIIDLPSEEPAVDKVE